MSTPLPLLLHADPWARELVDLADLNASASDAVARAIERARQSAGRDDVTVRGHSIVIVGPAGAGKTHLFARLRRRMGRRAAFVLVRPLLGAAISPRYLLMQVVEQLSRECLGSARISLTNGAGSRPVTQLDALLGWIAADALGAERDDSPPHTAAERDARVDRLVETVLARWPLADESYLRLLLRTPFAAARERRALLAWLSGREPDEADLARIGLRDGMREELVVPALKTLGAVAAAGAPLVVVLDQLENLIDPQDEGRVRAYGSLVSELVDEVPGVVLVQMALDSEWHRGIEPALSSSQRTRVAMELVALGLPNPKEREGLLRLWAERLGEPADRFPAPFGAESVRQWCAEIGLTPRMLLIAASRAIEQADVAAPDEPPAAPEELQERIEEALAQSWHAALERARALIDEVHESAGPVDAELVGDALSAAMRLTADIRVASVHHSRTTQLATSVDGERVLVAIVARSHPRTIAAALDSLVRAAQQDRVLAIRERAHELRPTWRVCLETRARFLESPNAHWLDLEREDLAKLLALQGLLADARSRDLTDPDGRPFEEEPVRSWARAALDVGSWAPLAALRTARARDGSRSAGEKRVPAAPGAHPNAEQVVPHARGPASDPTIPAGAPPRNGAAASLGVSLGRGSVAPTPAAHCRAAGPAMGALRQMRVASLDRLVREVARAHAEWGRAAVIEELEAARDKVRWFGRAVVAIREEP